MNPEHWQQLDELFHLALQLPPGERSALFEERCSGDAALRHQLEALLKAHDAAGPFMESPALLVEAKSVANQNDELVGQRIAQYEVLSQIGAGGMGAVYLAHDTKLSRKVALKLLPEVFTADKDRVRRFQQEARAASALNHPNIVTIYEIGEVDGKHFIATEFIDGETLGQQMRRVRSKTAINSETGFTLNQVLNIALQVADALTAAHAKRIVHRDIKPDNILLINESHLLQKEGFVKLVDFGIAKLNDQTSTNETDVTTRLLNTREGMVIGTASYMSPEQARGERVDSRTDVWSLGIVIYEMLSNRVPFEGDTAQDVIASILKEEPPPLPTHVPERLRRIVKKSLRKNREERYQTAREMFFDLSELRTNEIESRPAEARNAATGSKKGNNGATAAIATVTEGTSSPSLSVGRLLRIALPVLLGGLLVLLLYKFAGDFIRTPNFKSPNSAVTFRNFKLQRLTNSGKVIDAAISQDGKYVVYLVKDKEQQTLWMKQVSSPTSEVQIPVPADLTYFGLALSPSGEDLYLTAWDKQNPFGLYRMSLLGGVPQRLVLDIDSLPTFSPDGTQIAYLRGNPRQGKRSLLVANNDGSGEREVVSHKIPARFSNVGPAWSPKSNEIVIPVNVAGGDGSYVSLASVNPTDKTEKRITSNQWSWIERLVWLHDGSGLIVIAKERTDRPTQIWHVSYPGGEVQPITSDLNDYLSVTVTNNSKSLVTVESEKVSHVWVIPDGDVRKSVQITDDKLDGSEGMAWTSEGRIIYAARATDTFDLWIVNSDGTSKRQLTSNSGNNRRPFVTADGRYIVFVSDRTGTEHVWRIDIDGANPRQLTNGDGERNPQSTPDSQWVIYQLTDGKTGLWRVSIDGGESSNLVDKPTRGISISPDGKWIATSYFEPNAIKTAIYPLEGGEPSKILDISSVIVRWIGEGSELAYVDSRRNPSIIESQPVAGGLRKQIMDLSPDRVFYFVWSNDAKTLAVARGRLSQDVILLSNPKDRP